VLFAALLLSCFLSFLLNTVYSSVYLSEFFGRPGMPRFVIGIWCPPFLLALAAGLCLVGLTAPGVRRALRWRLPAFKEASLSQVASSLALMLKNGVPLDKALGLVERLERGTPAENELARWRQRLAEGRGKFSELAAGGRIFPALFVWMVGQSGEDLPAGFQRAAEIYQSRAAYRAETLLYSALPCAVLGLGLVIVSQIQPVLGAVTWFMNSIGDS
jgi:type II secretory pathway component PulF